MDDAQITAWALAAGDGDQVAAIAFIRATQRMVWRLLAHLAGADEADDLTQETYLRAMRGLPRFAAQSSARTWLLVIARRVAVDHIRTAVRRPRVVSVDDWSTAADSAGTAKASGFEDAVLLRHLIAGLAPDRREAFVTTQVLGLSYAEAAEVCDCRVGTIRSRVARAGEDRIVAMGQLLDHPGPRQKATG
jgi:RNA polymerase sigma-70 factor (ECF subfamily)